MKKYAPNLHEETKSQVSSMRFSNNNTRAKAQDLIFAPMFIEQQNLLTFISNESSNMCLSFLFHFLMSKMRSIANFQLIENFYN